MIIYFCFVLIYSRHNDVCLGVYVMVFMRIVNSDVFFMQFVIM